MTLKIDRETLPCSEEQFATAVASHAAALAEYNEHLKGVAIDVANEALTQDERRVAFPPPTSHPLVEAAIKAGGYELVGPSLDVLKQRLFQKVSEAEAAEIAKVTPPGKRRYFDLSEQQIRLADQKRLADYFEAHQAYPEDAGWAKSQRPIRDTSFLAEQDERRAEEAAIDLWAAKQHYDIEDLTEETVGNWVMTPNG